MGHRPSLGVLAGVSVLGHSPSLGVLAGVFVLGHSPSLRVLAGVSVLGHSPSLGVLAGVFVLGHSPNLGVLAGVSVLGHSPIVPLLVSVCWDTTHWCHWWHQCVGTQSRPRRTEKSKSKDNVRKPQLLKGKENCAGIQPGAACLPAQRLNTTGPRGGLT